MTTLWPNAAPFTMAPAIGTLTIVLATLVMEAVAVRLVADLMGLAPLVGFGPNHAITTAGQPTHV